MHRILCFLLSYALFFISCKKETTIVNPPAGQTGYQQYGAPFSQVPDNEDIVMYEINLRAFSESGDFNGVIARMNHLKSLGINVIWLMPIHPIGQINSVNSPYSVKDYKAVSPEYGDLDDLRTLTDSAHANGIAVIIDWVANHTAWDNAWIQNKAWYSQDASGNIIHPAGTNWMDVADLNFNHADMRKAMIDAMKYWVLEANIDGFRCDYADGVPYDFWKQAIDSLVSIPNRKLVFLAEGNRSDHFQAGFGLNYAWEFYGTLKNVFDGQNPHLLFTTHNTEVAAVPTGKRKLRFTTNHDESAWDATPMVIFNGKKGALAASVLATMMGGAPLIYTGQETGRVETVPFFSQSPIDWSKNPDMQLAYKSLMTFYAHSETARYGVMSEHPDFHVACFKKSLDNKTIWVIVNTRNNSASLNLPAEIRNSTWINALTDETMVLETAINLDAYQYYILKQ